MAVRIAIANPKGGVGKSTTTLMLAEGLALRGYRVLVLDLDPQAMASRVLIGVTGLQEVTKQNKTLGHLLRQFASGTVAQLAKFRTPASDLVELRDAGDFRCVDLIASNSELFRDLASLEAAIHACDPDHRIDVTLARLLGGGLDRLNESYDVILFDCPAGNEALTLAALRLSSHMIAPTNLEENSFWTLRRFLRLILEDDLGLARRISIHVLMTLYTANNPGQRHILDQIQSGIYSLNAIPRPVPLVTAIQRAEAHPGPGNYRRAREKYDGALVEVHALAKAIDERILEGNRT